MHVTEGYMPYLEYRTYYRIVHPDKPDPSKAPLLLLHGGPGSTHNYLEVLDCAADMDNRTLVMYDQLGCGLSWDDRMADHPELWTYETWNRELVAMRQHLQLDRCHLLGQSWGGMLAIEYLVDYQPEGICSAVLSSTLSSSRLWSEAQHRRVRYLPPDEREAVRRADQTGNYDDPAFRKAEAHFMRRHCCSEPGPDSPECLRRPKRAGTESYLATQGESEITATGIFRTWDYTDKLGQIKPPCLVISGTEDLCDAYVAKTLYDGIPHSRWELMPGCRHMCYVDNTPGYLRVLLPWLNAHDEVSY